MNNDLHAKSKSGESARKFRLFLGGSTLHLVCLALAMTMTLPFLWMLLTSLKSIEEIEDPAWLPKSARWSNYAEVFDTTPPKTFDGTVVSVAPDNTEVVLDTETGPVTLPINNETGIVFEGQVLQASNLEAGMEVRIDRAAGPGIPFGRFYLNSILVAGWVTFLQVLTSSFAAFAFSRLQWRGRDKFFLLYLATMMLPPLVMMIPNYQIMVRLGLIDSYAGLILPAAFSAFGTFLLRQFMMSIPTSLDEAAEIDGASKWQVFWEVILPLARPGLITLTIFTFLGAYRSIMWPLIMLKSLDKYTLPIGLMYFNSSQGSETQLLMAAATMMIIPLIVLFVLMQRWLVKGIQLGAVKG
jgi:multiple sugar transport system permease protein